MPILKMTNIRKLIVLFIMVTSSIWDVMCLKSKGFIIHPDRKSSGSNEITNPAQVVSSKMIRLDECMVSRLPLKINA